ncbi:hypothetical protein EUTSA_v10015144mg [Eutrema salsugineum]|uniref:Uncharacterized protein n=1 Tax=Eutrema salsugineum TaxID=72664 RepID=V4KW11_EUTSA|nr:hypothetical protein EUTSA_v10015144mg [Eutrema salsugineum]
MCKIRVIQIHIKRSIQPHKLDVVIWRSDRTSVALRFESMNSLEISCKPTHKSPVQWRYNLQVDLFALFFHRCCFVSHLAKPDKIPACIHVV